MSWRTVVISNTAKLDYQMGYMVVRKNELTKIHLSEIEMLIIESTSVSLTAALLSELTKKLKQKLSKHHYRTMMMDSYNRDILRCKCGSLLVYVDTYDPLQTATNDRSRNASTRPT